MSGELMPINLEAIFNKNYLQELPQPKRKSKSNRKRKKRSAQAIDGVVYQSPQLARYHRRLNKFHSRQSPNAGGRLRAVQKVSAFWAKKKITGEDLAAVRYSFNQKKYSLLKLKECYVCHDQATHRHHLVPLSQGGTNIKENLVGLCEPCHGFVHPWMRPIAEELELEERLTYLIKK